MIEIDASDLRLIERNESKAYRVDRGGSMNMIVDVVEDQAIDGQGLKFNAVFPYRGGHIMMKPGCFGDISNRRIGFRIDHEESMEVASTDDALAVMLDDDVLQFRLDLSKCKNGPIIARMCINDSRSAMSHGSDILEEHVETINGQSVRVVTRARLKELTICKEGAAGENAYAMVVDKTITPPPKAGTRSATMKAGQVMHRVSQKLKQLKAQVSAIYGDHEPQLRWPTLEESNRWETDEVDRLQKLARSRNIH